MAKEKAIRVRLTAYDHEILDQSVEKILAVAKKTNAGVKGPIPLPTEKQVYITNPQKDTVDALRKLDLPSGVDIDIKL